MQIEVKKAKMTKSVIKAVAEIDNMFYTNLDCDDVSWYDDLSWYYDRYTNKNDVFLLTVDGKIVGYFLFVEISKSLFDDILQLKYDNDYVFPPSDYNCKSGYFYMPSVVVKKEYRRFSLPFLRRLYDETLKKDRLVVITVSNEGHRMAEKFLNFVGVANAKKDVRVYVKK